MSFIKVSDLSEREMREWRAWFVKKIAKVFGLPPCWVEQDPIADDDPHRLCEDVCIADRIGRVDE